MPLFDTHAHYNDDAFDQDREELLDALPAAGVGAVVIPGVDAASSRSASWLYCSGTSSTRPPSPESAARRISSIMSAVLPAPARPVISLSKACAPLSAPACIIS